MRYSGFFILCMAVCFAVPVAAQQDCNAPEPVCAVAANVVGISGFEPVGSAVIIADGILVTNRHMVADLDQIEVTLPSGQREEATVIPTDFPGDLILLRLESAQAAVDLSMMPASMQATLYTIGFDIGRNDVRVYAPGAMIAEPADTPRARLHHTARSLPGNSGGALVDETGTLVGIVASGGEGRNEAIPVSQLALLKASSGNQYVEASKVIGTAYRNCYLSIEDAERITRRLSSEDAQFVKRDCIATGNRQMIDLAAQTLGRKLNLDTAVELSEAALDLDPLAPNSLISMAVSLHLARRYEEELPYLRTLMGLLPGDPQVLRLALQAAIFADDQDLADQAMADIERYIPQMVPAARNFYENPPNR